MEWIELLKMLSDQQTSETTQQQIETLQHQIHLIQTAQEGLLRYIWILFICIFGLFMVNGVLDFWIQHKLDRRIKKLEHKWEIYDSRFDDVISKFNSIKNKNGLLVEK